MKDSLNILIVEDEFLTSDEIKECLQGFGHQVVGVARDAEEAIHLLENTEADLAILDMNIQGSRDGIWLATYINSHYQLPFIYLTAYSDDRTVQDALETNPYGYIVKPFKKEDIHTAVELAIRHFRRDHEKQPLLAETELKTPLSSDDYLFVKEKNGHDRICVKDILYVKSDLKYVEIHLQGRKYLLRYNLSDFLRFLPVEFLRVHRSYAVNKHMVERIGANYVVVKGIEIPLSTQRKEELRQEFRFL